MKNKTQIERAVQTENQSFDEISERLIEHKDEVFLALNQAILAIQNIDNVVKKKVFYGKNPKHYEAPMFKGLDESVLKDKTFIRMLHAFMGITTEGSEGLEALAKHHSGEELDAVNISEELGDVFWYGALIADESNRTFEEIFEKVLQKLEKRHGEKFNKQKVMDRNLEAERKILET